LPNIKSAKKRVKVEKRNNLRNRKVKSEIKTLAKKFDAIIDEKDVDAAKELFRVISGDFDKAVLKGIVHKNLASRRKSALAKKLNSIAQ